MASDVRSMASDVRAALTNVGVWTSHPFAFVVVGLYVLCWLLFSPGTIEWHGIATIATWLMTLFIQRAEHRDTQAIHAKLDELLRAEGRARNDLTTLDDQEPELIEEHRKQERKQLTQNS
jgi:low affinity Fe/Cu permease